MKKIGIDVSMLVYQGSGVANYTYNIVKQLLLSDTKNEYRLFYSSFRRPKNFYYLDEFRQLGAKVYSYPFPPRILELWWNVLHIIPVEWLIGKVDWYFSSDFLRPPLLKGTRGITTIHDLTWEIFPQYHTDNIIRAHKKKLEYTMQERDVIVVDSKSTKNDLIKLYPHSIETNRIVVIYPGISDHFKVIKNQQEIQKVLLKYKLIFPKKYILYVGAIEPRKNIDTAIRVYAELIKDNAFSEFEFIIVGRAGWKNENIFSLINTLKLANKIHITGFVEDVDLPYFYNASEVCVYLSLYEGFGLPPIEAAQCGKFTLLYNISSLKELFLPSYLYAQKGEELMTLKKLILSKERVESFMNNFSWNISIRKFELLFE